MQDSFSVVYYRSLAFQGSHSTLNLLEIFSGS